MENKSVVPDNMLLLWRSFIVKASRIMALGTFISGILVLIFFATHAPHFQAPLSFLEQHIQNIYHNIILCDGFLLLLSGFYLWFSTKYFHLKYDPGIFTWTVLFSGVLLPFWVASFWYSQITHGHVSLLDLKYFIGYGFFMDVTFDMIYGGEETQETRAYYLKVVGLTMMISYAYFTTSMGHEAEYYLNQEYHTAASFPKSNAFVLNWNDVYISDVHEGLHNLGGDGALVVAHAYRAAGYHMPMVVWDNLLQLGQYVNNLQSHGLLKSTTPWTATPVSQSLKEVSKVQEYYTFFQHPDWNFYAHHSHFSSMYSDIESLHSGTYFTKDLPSVHTLMSIEQWLNSQRPKVPHSLGTESVLEFYKKYDENFEQWQKCAKEEGAAYCAYLYPKSDHASQGGALSHKKA